MAPLLLLLNPGADVGVWRFMRTDRSARVSGFRRMIIAGMWLVLPLAARGGEIVIYGTTPGGISMAVRAAREGKEVLLVGPSKRLGGMFSYGIGAVDSLYRGSRAPIFDEFRDAVHAHYRQTYGADSEELKTSLSTNTRVESHVAERLLTEMVAAEKRITVRRGFYPEAVVREGAVLRSVSFRAMAGEEKFSATAAVFADCSYEGDLAALAEVPYRTGRESRAEFNEEHAGRIFVREVAWPPQGVDPAYLAAYGKLNLTQSKRWCEIIHPQSTGEADGAVQAFSMRVLLTEKEANRVPITMPEGYDREAFLARLKKDLAWRGSPPGGKIPNGKRFILQPEIIGMQDGYAEGTWEERRKIVQEHRAMTMRLLYFLQNDPSMPEAHRREWSRYGLPKDEFADTGHLPDEIYVRETRRIAGRDIFTENSARLVPEIGRAPVVADSIGIAEWYLDSHACTAEKIPGSLWEGEFYLYNKTWPGQVPLGSILPQGLDNLVVPVCLSATHVGYGTVRVEPVWMTVGEAAAYLVCGALDRKVAPAAVERDTIIRRLAERGFLLAFYNDIENHRAADWYGAVQYFGTKGFLPTCDARPADALTESLADRWIEGFTRLRAGGGHDAMAMAMARACAKEDPAAAPVTKAVFLERLARATGGEGGKDEAADATPLTRAEACRILFAAMK